MTELSLSNVLKIRKHRILCDMIFNTVFYVIEFIIAYFCVRSF